MFYPPTKNTFDEYGMPSDTIVAPFPFVGHEVAVPDIKVSSSSQTITSIGT